VQNQTSRVISHLTVVLFFYLFIIIILFGFSNCLLFLFLFGFWFLAIFMLIKPVILFRNKSAKIYVRNFKVFVTEIVFLLFLLFCRNKSNEVEHMHFVLYVYLSIRSICPFIYLSFERKFAST
jgi:hypothetical protein